MTLITMQGDTVIMKAGAVGTGVCCCCNPCVCGGADITLASLTQLGVEFTVGANAGGMTIGDVCTYCLSDHYLFVATDPVQTTVGCNGCFNYIDIELKQNTSGPFTGSASGACLSTGVYRIRLYVAVGNLENCDCVTGDYCEYELTGWELLYSDFTNASFIGNITMGNYCA